MYVSDKCGELFTEDFVNIMKINMWTYMNTELIHTMFPSIKTKYTRTECYNSEHKNTICFIIVDEDRNIKNGHYTYVDANKIAHSTYEDGLIYKKDDGVCHGAAMMYALNANNYGEHDYVTPVLISYPKTPMQFRNNYRLIVQHYIWLIESGLWNTALREHFPRIQWRKDGTCLLTERALACLKQFIEELDILK